MAIKQIRVGSDNFSYVIYSPMNKHAALVDPGYDASQALYFLREQQLILCYIITTHYHGDHTNAVQQVKTKIPSALIVSSAADGKKLGISVDKIVKDGDSLQVGDSTLTIILTPGHTSGGICILSDNEALLTGDTLFIGDCGRTDLPGGDLQQMFHTLQKKILPLPDHLIIYPGHDYGKKPFDT